MSGNLAGSRLGKYDIQAEIGKGGMGLVYLAYDPMLDRQVAIKVLAPHLVWETGFVERFLREARAAARLKHAGIVTIYDVGQEGNWYYIVMEYLAGETLSHLIVRRGPFSSKLALPILRQLASALDYAHKQNLVHRDVKPGNIVVDGDGQATLTDFGVARAAQETRLTSTGALVGTPQYMSPEQALGEDIDCLSDIYSLGVVAYEMLTGRTPFGATTPHAVLHQLIYDPPPPLRSLRPDLPAEIDRVLDKVLAKKPADRYSTAQAFVGDLERALSGAAGVARARPRAAPPPAPEEGLARAPLSRPRSQRAKPAAKAGTAAGGMALWLWWFLASAIAWTVGWRLGGFAGEAVARPIGEAVSIPLAETMGGLVSWGVLGLVLGLAQWLVLRRYLPKAGWWVLATGVAGALVGSFKWAQGLLMDAILFEAIGPVEDMGLEMFVPAVVTTISVALESLTGLVIGLFQWLYLRSCLRRAGGWLPVSTLAWALGALVVAIVGWIVGEPDEETMILLVSTLAGLVLAAVTATGLVRLIGRA